MVVGAAGYQLISFCGQRVGGIDGIFKDSLLYLYKPVFHGQFEADGFCGQKIHRWGALGSREDGLIQAAGIRLFA